MERLTEYDYEQVVLKGLNIVGIGEKNADILESGVRRLAEYEDIGIPADDIKDILAIMSESQDDVDESGISVGMIHDLVELARYRESGLTPEEVKNLAITWQGKELNDHITELLTAEKQGLLHKAPVPDGTQVFIVHDEELAELLDEDYEQIKITNITYVYGLTEYSYGELGKGFFITREDAESYIKSQDTTDAP